jgi:hypothetical protein
MGQTALVRYALTRGSRITKGRAARTRPPALHARRNENAHGFRDRGVLVREGVAAKFTEVEALAALARGELEEQFENLTKPIGTSNPDCASHFQTA